MNVDGTGFVNLSELGGVSGGTEYDSSDDCPTFTPDGASIVFHHYPALSPRAGATPEGYGQ